MQSSLERLRKIAGDCKGLPIYHPTRTGEPDEHGKHITLHALVELDVAKRLDDLQLNRDKPRINGTEERSPLQSDRSAAAAR